MIFKSPFPDIHIPEVDIPQFIFTSNRFVANLDAPALIDAVTGRSVSFNSLRETSYKFARGLVGTLGIGKGDVIAVMSSNNLDYSSVLFGSLLAGACVTTINPSYVSEEVLFQLQDSKASVFIMDETCLKSSKDALSGISPDRMFVLSDNTVEGVSSFRCLLSDTEVALPSFTAEELSCSPAYLAYSSGTTGQSKGVILTHRNIIANVLQIHETLVVARTGADEVWLGLLPFFHVYALTTSLHSAVYEGIPIIVMASFDFALLLKTIQTYKVSTVHIVPPIALALAYHPAVDMFDLSSVKYITSAASPLSKDIIEALINRLHTYVIQGYGLTETSPAISLGTASMTIRDSHGYFLSNIEARVIDTETGKELGVGEQGELCVRGPNVMKGYFNNHEATAASIDSDGYFHTGDVAIVHESGEFTVMNRIKELIKYMGIQVAPAELEEKLLQYPKIADAAVIGRPDELSGEVPVAYVVLKPGVTCTEDEIKSFIAKNVASHKLLRGGVVFIEKIPRAPTGKCLRRILQQQDLEYMAKAEE
ncbi:hypothetical protein QVD99_007061 [Batrachochytrium dendrobatidis]|nr:hypothetical protein O5D80_007666 [Batrachochytrium dendrobatidis]KAK5666300.1 hypothetical protein QVD99_007061 [Batrachochytrium dendrobatidis]